MPSLEEVGVVAPLRAEEEEATMDAFGDGSTRAGHREALSSEPVQEASSADKVKSKVFAEQDDGIDELFDNESDFDLDPEDLEMIDNE